MKHKTYSFLLALLMSMVANVTSTHGAEITYGVAINGVYYNLNATSQAATVTSNNVANYSGYVVIPQTVTYKGTTYNVTSIGTNAFSDCSGLISVTIPNSVTRIAYGAFYGCSGLTSITIPNGVSFIGSTTFCYCSGLTSVTIPESVTTISDAAFSGCTNLTSITIPESVTSIGDKAFEGCSKLSIVISEAKDPTIGNRVFEGIASNAILSIPPFCDDVYENCTQYFDNYITDLKVGGLYFNIDDDGDGTAWVEEPILDKIPYSGDIVIPSTVMYEGVEYPVIGIDDNAFKNATITSVVIPNGVRSIAEQAFCYCTRLTSVTIPSSVTSIDDNAFYGCRGLTSVIIPSSVTSIGSSAFEGTAWYNNLPDGVVYAGKVVYKYKGTMPRNTTIELKEGTTAICDSAFKGCTGLTSVTIPSSVTEISSSVFSGCTGLTSVTIPISVTEISSSAFYGCTGLTSITIPESVIWIGWEAFSGCSGLTSVYALNPNPVWISSSTFSNHSNATLYVPYSCKAKYKAASDWNGFKEIVEIDKGDVNIDGKTDNTDLDLLTRMIIGITGPTGLADVNQDGKVSLADITTLTNHMMEKTWKLFLSDTLLAMKLDDVARLRASAEPASYTLPQLIWTSSDKSVAEVTGNGLVLAVGYGTCTITCTANDGSGRVATCEVIVSAQATGINLSASSLAVAKGGNQTLTATILPAEALQTGVAWTSSNESIAAVNQSGQITGISVGNCTITCTATDGSGVAATCEVAVWELLMSASTLNLEVDGYQKLTLSTNPNSFPVPDVTWTTSNANVADVTNQGHVYGMGAGTCTIACTATDGSGAKATCVVNVSE